MIGREPVYYSIQRGMAFGRDGSKLLCWLDKGFAQIIVNIGSEQYLRTTIKFEMK